MSYTTFMIDLQNALATGIKAAKAAAEIIVSKQGTDLTISTKSSARDLVTEADRKAQETIINIIQSEYPDHRFIAEETGADTLGDKDSPFVWIIDPIDGTTNFIHGKNHCGSLIALQHEDEFNMAVMYAPLLNHLYTCVRGEGAFLNEKQCTVRNTKNLDDAIVSANMGKRAKKDAKGVLQISTPGCGSLQNYGCALTEMGEVIRGLNDGIFYDGVGLWDIAAGCLLVEEAGGKVRYELIDESDVRKGVRCVASSPAIFEELCDFLF